MERAEDSQSMGQIEDGIVLLAPLAGIVVLLADVPDPVFAGGMFGDGIGIDPLDGRLVAPCDGVVTHLAQAGHAVTLQTPAGVQILLHVGIDTAQLNGQGFTTKVTHGEEVKAGDLLIEFDPNLVGAQVPSLVSVMAIANSDVFEVAQYATGEGRTSVKAGDTLLVLRRRSGATTPIDAAPDSVIEASSIITLSAQGGLHARPAARTREAARGFDARVEVSHGTRRANVQSVVALMGLGAGQGATVEVHGRGPDAYEAVEAVVRELLRETLGALDEMPARFAVPAPSEAPRRLDTSHDSNTLAGVCAAPGIAVGPLMHWGVTEPNVPEMASVPPAAESRRLDRALSAADAALHAMVRDASQRGAVGEAGIFAVHRVLLDDPTLVDMARDLISLGKSAGFAWREVIRAQTAVLAGVEDSLLAERAADLRDLEKRVLRELGYWRETARALLDNAVLAAPEFTPSDLASLDRARIAALLMAGGGATSHAAIIARQLGIPVLVALGDAIYALPEGVAVVVDASAGRLEYAPSTLDVERAQAERQRLLGVREANRRLSHEAATTLDGRSIEVAANIATLDDVGAALENGADAVGLLRTELLFMHRATAPSVEEHRASYQSIVDALAGRTAVMRTLDADADKAVPYLKQPHESNPALGLRGVRIAQVRPDLLDEQLRGLIAVTPHGSVRVLLPMITDADELRRLRERIDALARAAGRKHRLEVGAMIEVPSAALLADQIARYADFLSIGTNDLTQYTLAMDRRQSELAARADSLHPAVLRLIDATTRGAAKHGKPVAVCGALAADPLAVPVLVGLGVTELSVVPVALPGIKARVRRLDYRLCRQRAQDLLALESAQAVRSASRKIWPTD
jgi:phosphocarrier protein FPr